MSEMSGQTGRSDGYAATLVAVVGFAVAMGFVEAAVVVYLRAALEAAAALPAVGPDTLGTFEAIEVVREAATLAMIAAVGTLAGRSRLERLAWAAVVFGIWDVVYYLGLRLTIGWPPSLDTWDVLFLIPAAWVGPVWAPMVVSAALVAVGLAAARLLRVGRALHVGPARALAALVGGVLVVVSFLIDTERVAAGDTTAWTGWPLFWAGMVVAAGATAGALLDAAGRQLPGRTQLPGT